MKAALGVVVVVLGLVALAVVGGAIILALDDRPPLPTEIAMIGGAAVTALAAVGGVLAVSRPEPGQVGTTEPLVPEDEQPTSAINITLTDPVEAEFWDEKARWGVGEGL